MDFKIEIQGYYRDESREKFPNTSGIYFVYKGTFIPHLKSVTLSELLYVGEAENINKRLMNHERRNDFLSRLHRDENLFYSFANTDSLSENERLRVEAAFIYELQPPLNIKSTESFEYDDTVIHVIGDSHAYIPVTIKAPTY